MPWVRRSRSDALAFASRSRRRNLIEVLASVPLAGLALTVFLFLVPTRGADEPLDLDDAAFLGVVFAIGLAVWLLSKGHHRALLDRVICVECWQRYDRKDREDSCTCGGVLEPLAHWEWSDAVESERMGPPMDEAVSDRKRPVPGWRRRRRRAGH